MTKQLRLMGAVLAGVVVVMAMAISPAHADNPVITHLGAAAKYVDRTDQLCAKITAPNDKQWAEAHILVNGVPRWTKIDRGNGDRKWSCTRNLSIPEDERFTLLVMSCSKPTNSCAGKRVTFFS
ncbi:hypothetical protein ACHAAC_01010 [Aeromicrobium sp. CF4.19]|uniref:hypothetical protein n=1 Tax=Aeromicrobium sp. CF4.19 TaxID=3373082 RepID=UPI003EE6D9C3